jgi:hypothetical protein
MKNPDLVVGEIGFGNNFGASAELEFMRNEDRRHTAEIADLQRENRELIRSNNRLIRVINRCVKPSNEVANEAHDAIEEATAIR